MAVGNHTNTTPSGITCLDWECVEVGSRRCKHITAELAGELSDAELASAISLGGAFVWRGQCKLASHFPLCDEWLKKNPGHAPIAALVRAEPTLVRDGKVFLTVLAENLSVIALPPREGLEKLLSYRPDLRGSAPPAAPPLAPLPPVRRDLFGGIVPETAQAPAGGDGGYLVLPTPTTQTQNATGGAFPGQQSGSASTGDASQNTIQPPAVPEAEVQVMEKSGIRTVVRLGGAGGPEVHLRAARTGQVGITEITFREAAFLRNVLDIFPDAEIRALTRNASDDNDLEEP